MSAYPCWSGCSFFVSCHRISMNSSKFAWRALRNRSKATARPEPPMAASRRRPITKSLLQFTVSSQISTANSTTRCCPRPPMRASAFYADPSGRTPNVNGFVTTSSAKSCRCSHPLDWIHRTPSHVSTTRVLTSLLNWKVVMPSAAAPASPLCKRRVSCPASFGCRKN